MHRLSNIVLKGQPLCNIGKVMGVIERERTSFGQRLFDAREAVGLNQTEVCKRIGISQGTLSGLERTAHASRHTAVLAKCASPWTAKESFGAGLPKETIACQTDAR